MRGGGNGRESDISNNFQFHFKVQEFLLREIENESNGDGILCRERKRE